jgi:hypothetical protein
MDALLKPSDKTIRQALRFHLLTIHRNQPDTVIVDELGLCCGRVRLDVAVVNGLFHGYEIKSDRDSLRRLSDQANIYSQVLDRATIVVGNRYVKEASRIIPDWWEILRFDSEANEHFFEHVRYGRENPQRNARSLVELLWLDDAMAMLQKHGTTRGIKGKPRRFLWDRICAEFDVEEIAETVRYRLKERAAHRPLPRL